MIRHRRNGIVLAIVGIFLGHPASGYACSIPVFRYALERWQPSPYEMLIYHRGPLSPPQRKTIRDLEARAQGANVEITEIDLDKTLNAELKAIGEKHCGKNPLPRVLLRYPDSTRTSPPAWSGALDAQLMESVFDSPLRRQIVRKLFNTHSAVFVVLESGDEKTDAEATKIVVERLDAIEKKLDLPVPSKEGPQLRSEAPLRIAFSTLALSRKNPDERELVEMLLHCEEGLDKVQGPIVFAIFGQGRVLTALHGKALNAAELEATAKFVCGACSCQVKELNPGVDLLFRTNWKAFLEMEVLPPPRESRSPIHPTPR